MDSTADQDLKLRRNSAELVREFQHSLPRFLRKTGTVRRLVPEKKADQLIKLLEPFQEWPQLLDPHLSSLLEPLVSAFLDYLSLHTARYYRSNRQVSSLDVIPLPRAICKILYVFCKVRGNKVICRFLNNEPKYLEPILMALEIWTTGGTSAAVEDTSNHGPIVWEERFIMLLWLSHLMLAPFDLISMSSDNPGTDIGSPLLQIHWPESMPPIVNRLVNIASHHLGLPGKEREAAATLLVRLAVRVDMHRNGVQETLVNWSLSSLKTDPHNATATSVYAVIGIFSFLAGFVSSAETIVLKPLLMLIYNSIQQATSEPSPFYTETTSSAVARKLVIKIYRALAVAAIRSDTIDAATVPSLGEDGLEETIDRLLTALADKETSIRFAASKALSVISAHLEPDMVAQIVTVIEQSLIEDTLWEDASTGQSISGSDLQAQEVASASSLPESFELSLVAVNPLRWHGLVLSLAQLIFRGSMPRWMIPKAMTSLVLALQFEQRSSLGVSIGTNVRDAACFGLWALVRRYTTAELWGERTSKLTGQMESTIQVIANELVVAATLDASGNIRRGASAALQEMVGRHPDVIEDGISLVQAVDYHAVALRSNAMLEIAIRVSKSHRAYWYPILNGLLDWRGVLASDPQARHNAAEAVGRLVEHSHLLAISTTEILQKRLDRTPLNKAEERNGMLLALAQIVFARSNECLNRILVTKAVALNELMESKLTELCQTWYINCPEWIQINSPTDFERPPPFALPHPFSVESVKMKIVDLVLRTDLGCEAVCLLIHNISMAVAAETALSELSRQMSAEDLNLLKEAVEKSLQHSDPLVVSISSMAAGRLFRILDNDSQEEIVRRWARLLSSPGSITQEDRRLGLAAALGAVFVNIRKQKDMRPSQSEPLPSADFPPFSVPIVISEDSGDEEEPDAKKKPPSISPLRNIIISTLLSQLNNEHGVDLRCTVLRSLTSGVLESDVITGELARALRNCLNDYTTDRRGDVGSLVRTGAIRAVAVVLNKKLLRLPDTQELAATICGLAVERLDRVRIKGWLCLQANWGVFGLGPRPQKAFSEVSQTSTPEYFLQLLSLCTNMGWLRRPILEGYVTSAGAGSESLLRASREAFVTYTEALPIGKLTFLCICLTDIVRENATNERLVVPALDFIGYLFDSGVLPRLRNKEFGWSRLFTAVQQAHFKSSNVHKVEAAVKIYAGLLGVRRVRAKVLEKICSMLLHPFPKVRNAVAEALLIETGDEELMTVNWSRNKDELAPAVQEVRSRLGLGSPKAAAKC